MGVNRKRILFQSKIPFLVQFSCFINCSRFRSIQETLHIPRSTRTTSWLQQCTQPLCLSSQKTSEFRSPAKNERRSFSLPGNSTAWFTLLSMPLAENGDPLVWQIFTGLLNASVLGSSRGLQCFRANVKKAVDTICNKPPENLSF